MKNGITKYSLALGAASLLSLAPAFAADSPTDSFETPNTSLVKTGNWSASALPAKNVTGTISGVASGTPLGWNFNTNPGSTTFGDLDFTSNESNLVIGEYTTAKGGPDGNVNIVLAGSTLNGQSNTVLANFTGSSVLFENNVAPSGDDLSPTGLTTLTLGSTTNVIQASSSSSVIIDNVVTGTGDALTFLGGGKAGTTGGLLELGAGSANDVTGGVGANAPTPANAGSFSGTAKVQTSDKNSFTGGLTIGDVGGTANAGVVKVDGANALPTTGTVTVNANSQLVLNGSATYGGTTQNLVLNGTGTATTGGALTTTSGNASTWQGTANLASTSSVNVQGTTGTLTMSGAISGAGQLQSTGAGTLFLTGNNSNSGGVSISAGTTYANSATSSTGTNTVNVAAHATLGGSGVIDPTVSGAGVVLAASSNLVSGGIQGAVSSTTKAGTGLTLNNTSAQGTILDASLGANLTFSLGAGTSSGGAYNFLKPSTNSTFMTILGNTAGELKFSSSDTFTINDLTNGNLQVSQATPYLLISTTAGNNSDFSGLVTTGGVVNGVVQNGYVTNLGPIEGTITDDGIPATKLYLYDGDLELVPEPGTWALMLAGLLMLGGLARRYAVRTGEV